MTGKSIRTGPMQEIFKSAKTRYDAGNKRLPTSIFFTFRINHPKCRETVWPRVSVPLICSAWHNVFVPISRYSCICEWD